MVCWPTVRTRSRAHIWLESGRVVEHGPLNVLLHDSDIEKAYLGLLGPAYSGATLLAR